MSFPLIHLLIFSLSPRLHRCHRPPAGGHRAHAGERAPRLAAAGREPQGPHRHGGPEPCGAHPWPGAVCGRAERYGALTKCWGQLGLMAKNFGPSCWCPKQISKIQNEKGLSNLLLLVETPDLFILFRHLTRRLKISKWKREPNLFWIPTLGLCQVAYCDGNGSGEAILQKTTD